MAANITKREASRQENTFEWKYKYHLQSLLAKKVDSELNLVPSSD